MVILYQTHRMCVGVPQNTRDVCRCPSKHTECVPVSLKTHGMCVRCPSKHTECVPVSLKTHGTCASVLQNTRNVCWSSAAHGMCVPYSEHTVCVSLIGNTWDVLFETHGTCVPYPEHMGLWTLFKTHGMCALYPKHTGCVTLVRNTRRVYPLARTHGMCPSFRTNGMWP